MHETRGLRATGYQQIENEPHCHSRLNGTAMTPSVAFLKEDHDMGESSILWAGNSLLKCRLL